MDFIPNKLLLNLLAAGLMLTSYLHADLNLKEQQPKVQKKPKLFTQPNQQSKQNQTLTWKPFTSTESGFTAMFPTVPQHLEQKITIPKTDISIEYHTYISEPNDKAVYVISVWNYPAVIDMSRPEINLQDGFSGMLQALPGSEVQQMKTGEIQGFKTLDFLVKNEDILFQGRLILVHNTLYQIFVVYKDSQSPSDSHARFINSFKLINPDSRKIKPERFMPENGVKQKNSKMKVTL